MYVRECTCLQCGVINGTQEALDVMAKSKGGRGGVIINIASTAGRFAFEKINTRIPLKICEIF